MNVYDFDKTIYDGDSTIDFYFFCLKKRPLIIFSAFRQFFGIFLHFIGKADTARMKEYFFSFLCQLKDAEALVESFWDKNQSKIKKWYKEKMEETDLVISASPEFLICPICNRLGIQKAIATRMDIASGRIQGKNCKGQEKVDRFFERYPEGTVKYFYSDSLTDAPLAKLSQEAFLVKGDELTLWELN